MVVGQDQRFLGALVVPNVETVGPYAAERGIAGGDLAALAASSEVQGLIQDEVQSRVNARNGFKSFERIARIALLDQPFTVGDQLTHTLKMRRHVIAAQYEQQIADLFK